ncbi:MAG: cupin domain-containing protein [Chitinophagales bacterium]
MTTVEAVVVVETIPTMTSKKNILQTPVTISSSKEEIFEALHQNDKKGVLIERIISAGQITPENEWYDQEKDEWVVLLQGKATLLFDEVGGELLSLKGGDSVFIEAKRKHRVVFTSKEPACIWLAVHF